MTMPQLKRWWFLVPLPGAMLLAGAIALVKGLSSGGEEALYLYTALLPFGAVVGGVSFPIGLIALFCRDPDVLQQHFDLWVCCGYGTYAVLMLWGIIRPNRAVFLVFCLLLLANVAGCQFEHAAMVKPVSR